jgi:peptide deformylase
MILPIVAYGNPILRKVCENITPAYPGLDELIKNMWETMYNSNGVGLAAPQVNKDIRMFMVDSEQVIKGMDEEEREEYPGDEGFKGVFINARIVSKDGDEWPYNEGCLSIPKIREDILRQKTVKIRFRNPVAFINFYSIQSTVLYIFGHRLPGYFQDSGNFINSQKIRVYHFDKIRSNLT